MVDFSNFPLMQGYHAPARFAAEVLDCELAGAIPADLNGAFYRMHADWFYPPAHKDEASLSADGYISAFRFRDGVVDYRGRYVRTERFEAQNRARRQLYGYYRNPYTDDEAVRDPEQPGRRTAANTTPVFLGGRLYATKEDGLPHQIDPETLETLRVEDFGGRWQSQTFTAHPKVDPITGETIAFGYEATGLCSRDVFLYIFDQAGRITREFRFEVPYTSAIHDIAITPNYVIFPASSLVTSEERLQEGKVHWGWDRTVTSWYGIVSRSTGEARWFFGPERSIVHTANAWETEDGKVVLDLPMADGNTWPFFPDVHGGAFRMHPFTLRRLTFDLASPGEQYHEECLFDTEITSFTRIDERFTGRPNRFVYVQYADRSRPFDGRLPSDQGRSQPTNSIARLDLKAGTSDSLWVGSCHTVQEPTFVPREGAKEEGEGYLLATVHNLEERRAELVIADAVGMMEIGRVILPFRNAQQVHGLWIGEESLPQGGA